MDAWVNGMGRQIESLFSLMAWWLCCKMVEMSRSPRKINALGNHLRGPKRRRRRQSDGAILLRKEVSAMPHSIQLLRQD